MPLTSGCPSSVDIGSNPLNSSFAGGSLNSFTAGNTVLSDLNFRVKRGPISCNAAFYVDLKAFLGAHESAYRYRVIGWGRSEPVTPEKYGISLVVRRDHLPALELGHGGGRCLEHPPNGVPQPRCEVVQNKSAGRDPAI